MTSTVFSCFFFLTLKCILWSSGTEVSSTHRKLTVCKLYITFFRRIINIIYSREQLAPAVGLPWLPPPLSLYLSLSAAIPLCYLFWFEHWKWNRKFCLGPRQTPFWLSNQTSGVGFFSSERGKLEIISFSLGFGHRVGPRPAAVGGLIKFWSVL